MSALREELALEPFFTDGPSVFTFGRAGSVREQREGRRHLFDALTAPHRTPDTRACGAKCAFGHGAQAHRFVEVVQKEFPKIRIIHVIRHDWVAQFGSLKKAQMTGVFHQTGGRKVVNRSIELDPYGFAEYTLAIREANDYLRQLEDSHSVLTIECEPDILEGNIRTNESLFEFVTVPYRKASWLHYRKVSPPPEAHISNYVDLRELQKEIEEELSEGQSLDELRDRYRPPFWRRAYRTGKHWIQHPGYAVYQIKQGVERISGNNTDESSR